jgi:hypothetical protein
MAADEKSSASSSGKGGRSGGFLETPFHLDHFGARNIVPSLRFAEGS